MGWDQRTLPADSDERQRRPWKGYLVAVVILLAALLIAIWAFGPLSEATASTTTNP